MIGNEPSTENVGAPFPAVGSYGDLEIVSIDLAKLSATFQVRFADGTLGEPEKVAVWRILPNSPEDSVAFWNLLVGTIIEELRKQGRVPAEYRSFELSKDEDATGILRCLSNCSSTPGCLVLIGRSLRGGTSRTWFVTS